VRRRRAGSTGRRLVAALFAFVAGCERGSAPSPAVPTPIPFAHTPSCFLPLTDYCAPGTCPVFTPPPEECPAQTGLLVEEWENCPGEFWRHSKYEQLLGGYRRYYDGRGLLIGVYLFTDYTPYCGGTSFIATYGTTPTCSTLLELVRRCRVR
jgi:hypothetical protein